MLVRTELRNCHDGALLGSDTLRLPPDTVRGGLASVVAFALVPNADRRPVSPRVLQSAVLEAVSCDGTTRVVQSDAELRNMTEEGGAESPRKRREQCVKCSFERSVEKQIEQETLAAAAEAANNKNIDESNKWDWRRSVSRLILGTSPVSTCASESNLLSPSSRNFGAPSLPKEAFAKCTCERLPDFKLRLNVDETKWAEMVGSSSKVRTAHLWSLKNLFAHSWSTAEMETALDDLSTTMANSIRDCFEEISEDEI